MEFIVEKWLQLPVFMHACFETSFLHRLPKATIFKNYINYRIFYNHAEQRYLAEISDLIWATFLQCVNTFKSAITPRKRLVARREQVTSTQKIVPASGLTVVLRLIEKTLLHPWLRCPIGLLGKLYRKPSELLMLYFQWYLLTGIFTALYFWHHLFLFIGLAIDLAHGRVQTEPIQSFQVSYCLY